MLLRLITGGGRRCRRCSRVTGVFILPTAAAVGWGHPASLLHCAAAAAVPSLFVPSRAAAAATVSYR